VINGWDAVNAVDKTSFYVGGTFNTPVTTLKVGVGYDYVILGPNTLGGTPESSGYQNATGLYLNWQATEKLAFNTRAEYASQSRYLGGTGAGAGIANEAVEFTESAQYDLWKNVVSRLEFRWDRSLSSLSSPGGSFGTGAAGPPASRANAFLLAANIIYKF
jgi:hypothetical protein